MHFRWRYITECGKCRIMLLLKMGRKFSSMLLVSNSKREAGLVIVSAGSFSSPRPSELGPPDAWLPAATCLSGLQHLPQAACVGLPASLWQMIPQAGVLP